MDNYQNCRAPRFAYLGFVSYAQHYILLDSSVRYIGTSNRTRVWYMPNTQGGFVSSE